jgi:adenosylmethionine-8-amino-7-oxononanoate aminotransferase
MRTATPPTLIKSAKGAYLLTQDGREIFDGISSWWLITHGHGRPEIAEAIANQAINLEQVVFANFTHEPAEQLSELLINILPEELKNIFLSDNGSTSVEVAMKMTYQFWRQKGFSRKTKFVTFSRNYHGDTCGVMSASGSSLFNNPYKGLLFDVIKAEQGKSISDSINIWTESFENLIKHRSDEIIAVIIEPLIQGAGGMVIWPAEAIQKIIDLARLHDVLVIFDEVMTGFGRTGTLFAFEQVARVPDILCLSKGVTGGFLPLGLTITSNKIYEAFLDNSPEKMLFHGHSFTGNAISCAAACANLKLFKSMNLSAVTSTLRESHLHSLQKMTKLLPIKETRVCGTIGVMELDSSSIYSGSFSNQIHTLAMSRNLFIRPLGNIIYLMPPYCSSAQEVEEAWNTIGEVTQRTLSIF